MENVLPQIFVGKPYLNQGILIPRLSSIIQFLYVDVIWDTREALVNLASSIQVIQINTIKTFFLF